MKLYSHPKCSTCRKAIDFLEKNDVAFEVADIVAHPPTKTELRRMLEFQNGDIRKLFNTSGMQYREQKIKDKLPGLSEDEALTLLSGNGMLIKRPFVVARTFGLIGFKPESWKRSLSSR